MGEKGGEGGISHPEAITDMAVRDKGIIGPTGNRDLGAMVSLRRT